MKLMDAHTHLQDERLLDRLPALLEKARAAEVTTLISCAAQEQEWPALEHLALCTPCIIPAFGIHPWYAETASPGWAPALEALLLRLPQAGVGETGLDYHRKAISRALQLQLLTEHIRIAKQHRRLLTLHCVHAWGDLLKIVKTNAPFPRGFILHAFSGSPGIIPALADLGAWFSFSGSLTYPRNNRMAAAARAAPLHRLLIETDSPDMPLYDPARPAADHTPRLNEPANLPRILERLAELRQRTPGETAAILAANAVRLLADT